MTSHRRLALGVLIALSSATARSEAARWEQATLYSAEVIAIAASPSDPQVFYSALTALGAIARSDDGARTWHRQNSEPVFGGADFRDQSLAVDAENPDLLYLQACRGPGCPPTFRSLDAGATWSALPVPPSVWQIVADPVRSRTVFAATDEGLLRSTDAGETWTAAGFRGTRVYRLAIDPHDAQQLWVLVLAPDPALEDGRWNAWRSADGGTTWLQTSLRAPRRFTWEDALRDVVADPSHPGTWYFVGDRVWRTRDAGATWTRLRAGVGRLVVAANGDWLRVSEEGGVFRSRDEGATWTPSLRDPRPAPDDLLHQLIAPASSPGSLLVAGNLGVWRSSDSGTTWRLANRGLIAVSVAELLATPGAPGVLALTSTGVDVDLWRGLRLGTVWRTLRSWRDDVVPRAHLAVDPHDWKTLYAAGRKPESAAQALIRSSDGGRTWSALPFPIDDRYICHNTDSVSLDAIAIDDATPPSVYVSAISDGWHCAVNRGFLLRTDDDFAHWTSLRPPGRVRGLAIEPKDRRTLYALTCGPGLMRSGDGGAHWQRLGAGLPDPEGFDCPGTLAQDPSTGALYASRTATAPHAGVFRSLDGGRTFQPMGSGLEGLWVRRIVARDGALYAGARVDLRLGAHLGHVFRFDTAAGRWQPLDDGLPVEDVTGEIALDPDDASVLYAATYGQGVFLLRLRP
jgi:photosystem II stability/assembly factor-like uncharacterized protein